MYNLRKIVVAAMCMLSMTSSFGDDLSPSEVVKRYCELDANGARLSSETYGDVRQLMAWEDDRDEPGWDGLKVIDGFEVIREEITGKEAKVVVRYNILAEGGVYELDVQKTSEDLEIALVRRPDGWRLVNYVPLPRIYINTAIDRYNELSDFYDIKNYDCIMRKLNNLLQNKQLELND